MKDMKDDSNKFIKFRIHEVFDKFGPGAYFSTQIGQSTSLRFSLKINACSLMRSCRTLNSNDTWGNNDH